MTNTIPPPSTWHANLRDAQPNDAGEWRRPADAVVTAYCQPWDDQLPEDALSRDASWRAADRKDLLALALWGLPVVAALIAAAIF
jgi:hypothetical protein